MLFKEHRGWKVLPKWVRWAFYKCSDCGVALRNAKSGKGFGTPHPEVKNPFNPDNTKFTSYKCLSCEMEYDED
jgi:DNA-directed RNA polymerase subunit RPC12/RpoP